MPVNFNAKPTLTLSSHKNSSRTLSSNREILSIFAELLRGSHSTHSIFSVIISLVVWCYDFSELRFFAAVCWLLNFFIGVYSHLCRQQKSTTRTWNNNLHWKQFSFQLLSCSFENRKCLTWTLMLLKGTLLKNSPENIFQSSCLLLDLFLQMKKAQKLFQISFHHKRRHKLWGSPSKNSSRCWATLQL